MHSKMKKVAVILDNGSMGISSFIHSARNIFLEVVRLELCACIKKTW